MARAGTWIQNPEPGSPEFAEFQLFPPSVLLVIPLQEVPKYVEPIE
jgi:hypothetical protein